tara:strand:- start:3233 stop:3997 length:765 start_codon:yes stop_codon:yes gene_type:complete
MKAEYFLNKNLKNSKLIEDILNKISFRFINNLMNREESLVYKTCNKFIPKKYRDFLNIKIEDKKAKKNYFEILDVKKMATFSTFFLINSICKNIDGGSYLNIGIWNGFSLFCGMTDTKCEVVGVDNFSEFDGNNSEQVFYKKFNSIRKKNHSFIKMDALKYLKNCNKKFDFYFYDALHTFEYQYEALRLADPVLKKGSLILVDDICWNHSDDPIKASNKFLEDYKHNYKLLLDVRTKYNQHPTFWNGYYIIEKI